MAHPNLSRYRSNSKAAYIPAFAINSPTRPIIDMGTVNRRQDRSYTVKLALNVVRGPARHALGSRRPGTDAAHPRVNKLTGGTSQRTSAYSGC